MASALRGNIPVKAWIEPDRLAFARAFPLQMTLFAVSLVACSALAFGLHPLFWGVVVFVLVRQAALEASLRELFREGALHPAELVPGRRLLATLVRLAGPDGAVRDAVMISRVPRRWRKARPPWGGRRVAVVVAGEAPQLKPLSPDIAGMDECRARCSVERIPERQWHALHSALDQMANFREGLHLVELSADVWSTPELDPLVHEAGEEEEADSEIPERLTENATSVWCASLPCIEEPRMEPDELGRVRWLLGRAFRMSILWFLLWLTAVLGSSGLLWSLTRAGSAVSSFTPWLALACSLAALWWFSLWLRSVRTAHALRRDHMEGRVLRFAGTLSNFESLALDADLALLFRRGLLTADSSMYEELIVLPHSGQLLYAGKQWAALGVRLARKRIADPPREPIKSALPAEFAADRFDRSVALARRRFTDQELAELCQHRRTLQRPGPGFWWVCGLSALALGVWHSEGFRFPPTSGLVSVAVIALAFLVWSTLRRLRLAARIGDDIELGWLLTVDPGARTVHGELPSLGVETLLHAQLDWTVSKRPVVWRRLDGLK